MQRGTHDNPSGGSGAYREENIGFILVTAENPSDQTRFCELATGSGFQSAYESHKSGITHPDHIRFSKLIPMDQSNGLNSRIRAVQFLSIAQFTGSDHNNDIDVFISLSSLVAALHMRSQPLLGVIHLHPHGRAVRLGKTASLHFGAQFIGSRPGERRSRFALVAPDWLSGPPDQSTAQNIDRKERELVRILSKSFGGLDPSCRTLRGVDSGDFAYYRLSPTRSNTAESLTSIQTILASFAQNHTQHSVPPLLYSELVDTGLGRGLYDTTLGAGLGKKVQENYEDDRDSSDESEDFLDDYGDLNLDVLDETAGSDMASLKLWTSSSAGQFVRGEMGSPRIRIVLDVAKEMKVIVVFGYHEALKRQFTSMDEVPKYLPLVPSHVSGDPFFFLLLPGFLNSEVDELTLTSAARRLLFMKKYQFKLLGVVSLLSWHPSQVRMDRVTRHNLDMVHEICGPESLGMLALVKISEAKEVGKWKSDEKESMLMKRFKDAGTVFVDSTPIKNLGDTETGLGKRISVAFLQDPSRAANNLDFGCLALVEELEGSKFGVAMTSSGQLVQRVLAGRLERVQEEIKGISYHVNSSAGVGGAFSNAATPTTPMNRNTLMIRALYLQVGLIRFSESYNIFGQVLGELEQDVGLEKAIRRLEGILMCCSDLYVQSGDGIGSGALGGPGLLGALGQVLGEGSQSGGIDAGVSTGTGNRETRVAKDTLCSQLGGLYQAHFESFGGSVDLEKSVGWYKEAVRVLDVQWEVYGIKNTGGGPGPNSGIPRAGSNVPQTGIHGAGTITGPSIGASTTPTLTKQTYTALKTNYLHTLTTTLDTQFKLFGKKNDLVDAIEKCREVVNLLVNPDSGPVGAGGAAMGGGIGAAGLNETKKAVAFHALGVLMKKRLENWFQTGSPKGRSAAGGTGSGTAQQPTNIRNVTGDSDSGFTFEAGVKEALTSFRAAETSLRASGDDRAQALGIPIVIADICSTYTLSSKFHWEGHVGSSMNTSTPAQRALRDIENAIGEYERMRPEPDARHPAYPVLQNVKCVAWGKHFKMCVLGALGTGKIIHGTSATAATNPEVQGSDKSLNPGTMPSIDTAIYAGEQAVKYSRFTVQECGYLVGLGKAYGYRWVHEVRMRNPITPTTIGGGDSEDEEARSEDDKGDTESTNNEDPKKDLDDALLCLEAASACENAEYMARFKAARNWGRWAEAGLSYGSEESEKARSHDQKEEDDFDDLEQDRRGEELISQVLKSYNTNLSILSELVSMDIPIDEQYRRIEKMQSVARKAVGAVLELCEGSGGHPRSGAKEKEKSEWDRGEKGKYLRTAVEWFERGRGLVWKNYFRMDEVIERVRRRGRHDNNKEDNDGGEADKLIKGWESNWALRRMLTAGGSDNGLSAVLGAEVGDGNRDKRQNDSPQHNKKEGWELVDGIPGEAWDWNGRERIEKRKLDGYLNLVEKGKEIWGMLRDFGAGGDSEDGGDGDGELSWEKLKRVPRFGPVVIFNMTAQRCDAIILAILPRPNATLVGRMFGLGAKGKSGGTRGEQDTEIRHVPLKGIDFEKVKKWEGELRSVLEEGGFRMRGAGGNEAEGDSRGAITVARSDMANKCVESILKGLWRDVVGPVTRVARDEMGMQRDSRIFWCASGPLAFLPLHAAGDYTSTLGDIQSVQEWFVPSYIPNLYTLLRVEKGSEGKEKASKRQRKVLAVAQSVTPGYSNLPGTIEEVEEIRTKVGIDGRVRVFVNEEASVEVILKQVAQCEWVHFACHGQQDAADGLKSALVLFEGKGLTLRELIEMPRAPGFEKELAYLSACQSAVGDVALPEEHVHLAAGMLVVGYKSVVASMWSIGDRDGVAVAKGVYERAPGGDYSYVAKALRDAVADLRKRKPHAYLEWTPFVHVGL